MAEKTIEEAVRAALRTDRSQESRKTDLEALVEMRMDSFGNFFFVRKGAPIDLDLIQLADRVDVDDARDGSRQDKRQRYLKFRKDAAYKGPFILAEGDSWFEYPFATDLIDYAGKQYAVLSLAKAGDTWGQIIDQDSKPEKKYSDDGTSMGLRHTLAKPDVKPFTHVMLSVGGNDLIGQIRFCVHKFDLNRPEDDYIKHEGPGAFDSVLQLVLANYRSVIDDVTKLGLSVILHTYDYPNPKSGGQYIGFPLEDSCKFPKGSVQLMRRVVNQMINLFHDGLAEIANGSNGKVHLIDLRKTIGTDDIANGPDDNYWKDEMHGNNQGFKRLWQRMDQDLKKIFSADDSGGEA
jgi:hypothetical protein